jgi:hypothetical protein
MNSLAQNLFTPELIETSKELFKESKLQFIFCPNLQIILGGNNFEGGFTHCHQLTEINLPKL